MYEVGKSKTGGRTKGTPNKRSSELKQALEDNGIDPVSVITDVLPELTPKEKLNAMLSLMPYIYPKRKPIEISFTPPPEKPNQETNSSPESLREALLMDPMIDWVEYLQKGSKTD
jgi:hypothetical protein